MVYEMTPAVDVKIEQDEIPLQEVNKEIMTKAKQKPIQGLIDGLQENDDTSQKIRDNIVSNMLKEKYSKVWRTKYEFLTETVKFLPGDD